MHYYVKMTGRRVIFEYALIAEVNDLPVHAQELASRLKELQCHVNLIPLNAVEERAYGASSKDRVQAFLTALTERGISATVRREMGSDIAGACGQLRRSVLEKEER